jgi:hypothetical protein
MARCSGIRADGERCGAQAIRDQEFCIAHHPDYAGARRRRNSKGGKRGGRGRPMVDLAQIKGRLHDLVEDVLEGRTDRSDAAVVGQLLNTYIRAVSVELKAREQLELVERLEALEQGIEQSRSTRGYGA